MWSIRADTAVVCFTVVFLAHHAAAVPKVAIVGAGVGGTAAAHFLRRLQPTWHLELFERDRIGGRTQELFYDGKTLELGASIIHAQNQYVLSLAKEMGLNAVQGDDTGSAFSIYDGNSFVFKQEGSAMEDTLAVLRRYGVTPLRYKWLAEEMGRRFARIYALQGAGHAYTTPQELWETLDLFNVTQQSAASYMQDHLAHGWFRYGASHFIEELAGAINRINYNQANQVMNALAGLVSYLPAAQPQVYSIQEGNAALPRKLAAASNLQAVHVGVAVQAVRRESNGQYSLLTVALHPSNTSSTSSTDVSARSATDDSSTDRNMQSSSTDTASSISSTINTVDTNVLGSTTSLQEAQWLGPFDGVILASPLEGSGIDLQDVLPPGATLPKRSYQSTVTTYVLGAVNPKYFKMESLPAGDIFVSNSAQTPFSVIASKGTVSAQATLASHDTSCFQAVDGQQTIKERDRRQQQGQLNKGDRQLWKIFSEQALSEELLQQLFVGADVVISKPWMAYPRFNPPEEFVPFALAPGLCYNNALENGASAMEVSAVAAMNCALLTQQALAGQACAAHGSGCLGADDLGAVAAS